MKNCHKGKFHEKNTQKISMKFLQFSMKNEKKSTGKKPEENFMKKKITEKNRKKGKNCP